MEINIKMEKGMDMESQKNESEGGKEHTVEQILPLIGENGLYQKLLTIGFTAAIFAAAAQPVLSVFMTLTPTWKCVANNGTSGNKSRQCIWNGTFPGQDERNNSTQCIWNGTFPGQDERRCHLERHEWEYTKSKHFSLVTQFDLDCERKSIITLIIGIFFIGEGIGAIVSGAVADRYGRRITFLPTFAMILLLGFVSPFVDNVYVIIAFRFCIGFAYPSIAIQATVLITEFVGNSYRHVYIGSLTVTFYAAWVVLGVKAYYLQSWKYLSIACTAPYAFILLFHFFIPESARWLHLKNRNDEAMDVLRNIAKWNKRRIPDNLTLTSSNQSTVTVYRPKTNLLHLFKTHKLAVRTCAMMLVWLGTVIRFTVCR